MGSASSRGVGRVGRSPTWWPRICASEAGLDFGAAADDPLGAVEVRLDGGVAGAGGAAEDDVVGVRPVGRPLLSERGLDEELLDARVVRYDLLAPGRRDRVVAGQLAGAQARAIDDQRRLIGEPVQRDNTLARGGHPRRSAGQRGQIGHHVHQRQRRPRPPDKSGGQLLGCARHHVAGRSGQRLTR